MLTSDQSGFLILWVFLAVLMYSIYAVICGARKAHLIAMANSISWKVRLIPRSLRSTDWKWFIIVILLLKNIQLEIVFVSIFIMGLVSAPSGNPTVERPEVFIKVGQDLGVKFSEILITLINAGYTLGSSLYPWNQVIGEGLAFAMVVFIGLVLLWLLGAMIMKVLPERWIFHSNEDDHS